MCRRVAGTGCHIVPVIHACLESSEIEGGVGNNGRTNVVAVQFLANDLKVIRPFGVKPEHGGRESSVAEAKNARASLDTEVLTVDLRATTAGAVGKDLEAVGICAAGRCGCRR
jgi:hypothetical protein